MSQGALVEKIYSARNVLREQIKRVNYLTDDQKNSSLGLLWLMNNLGSHFDYLFTRVEGQPLLTVEISRRVIEVVKHLPFRDEVISGSEEYQVLTELIGELTIVISLGLSSLPEAPVIKPPDSIPEAEVARVIGEVMQSPEGLRLGYKPSNQRPKSSVNRVMYLIKGHTADQPRFRKYDNFHQFYLTHYYWLTVLSTASESKERYLAAVGIKRTFGLGDNTLELLVLVAKRLQQEYKF